MSNNPPLVVIFMLAYNHGNYIRQAIESVMQQDAPFTLRLIIGEDCSKDDTRQICNELYNKYSDRITLIAHEQNVGPARNALTILNLCINSGAKYIAVLEGDDYWNDTGKLRKQVEFLERHPEFSVCFHRAYEEKSGKTTVSTLNPFDSEQTFTAADLSKYNFIHTPTIVFRNILKQLPDWYNEILAGDYVLSMLHARSGKIKYFPDAMAVYRVHEGGVWAKKNMKFQYVNFCFVLDKLFHEFPSDPIVVANLKYQYATYMSRLAEIYYGENDIDNYQHYLKVAFDTSPEFMKEWLIAMKKHGSAYLTPAAIKRKLGDSMPLFKKMYSFLKSLVKPKAV